MTLPIGERMSRRRRSARPPAGALPGPGLALVRRRLLDTRVLTGAFAYLFAIYAYIQPSGYRTAYPKLADRIAFAHSFATNKGLRLLYGQPHDVATVTGYTAWRVGGVLAIAAAVYGLLAAVRLTRGEEESGRLELVLAGPVARRTVNLAALGALITGALVLWVAELAGFLVAGLSLGGSAYLALATASIVPGVRRRLPHWPASLRPPAGSRSSWPAAPSHCCFCCGFSPTRSAGWPGCDGRRRSDGPSCCARSPMPGRSCCCSRRLPPWPS